MANLDETTTGYNWDKEGVYQIEKNDPVEGGADGISNRQAKQLAVRTRDLHTRLSALKTEAADLAAELTQLTAEVDVKVGEAKTYTEQQVQGAKSYTDDREVLIRKDLESGDAGTLTSAKGYTDAREELIRSALESGDAATLSDAETYADGLISGLVDSAPAGLNTLKKLASAIGNNATFSSWVTTQLSGKQATIKNVNIPNFNSFNPTTLGLAVGEYCNFNHYSETTTTGRPTMGRSKSSTADIFQKHYAWSGTVTRISVDFWMVTAYGQAAIQLSGRPQMATRLYNGSMYYDWIISTDYSERSTSGFVKLPSGMMIQWGSANGGSDVTITYPLAFKSVYAVWGSGWANNISDNAGICVSLVTSPSTSSFRAKTHGFNNNGGVIMYPAVPIRYIAIGTWK